MKRRSTGSYTIRFRLGIVQPVIKNNAGHQCENCGLQFPQDSNVADDGTVGGCHHIDHNRANDAPQNLVYLCQRCHLEVHRWGWMPGDELPAPWREQLPAWIRNRNLPYTNSQKKLL